MDRLVDDELEDLIHQACLDATRRLKTVRLVCVDPDQLWAEIDAFRIRAQATYSPELIDSPNRWVEFDRSRAALRKRLGLDPSCVRTG